MNFRRFGKYICVMSLAASMSMNVMGATIADVNDKHWAYTAISDLEERGIMVLTSNGQFYPNQEMNYFELADVIAKATGYVDVDIATNVTDSFKQQVKANYEKQMKEVINEYATKYKSWNNAYNQQIAYVLGRGYMNKADLDKFITQTAKGETKNIATKEELCVYLVKMLQKETTAKNTYKTTNFKDDSTLQPANKPYVAYLASVGVVTANNEGKVNGTMKMTKALCAKMVSDTLKIKDTTQVGRIPNTTNQTNTTNPNGQTTNTTNPNGQATNTTDSTGQATNTASDLYTVQRVVTKSPTEYYVGVKNSAGTETFYSLKNTTKIYDNTGVEIPVTKLMGTMVNMTIELQEGTNYITSIRLAGEVGGSNQTTLNTQGSNVSGSLSSPISNGIIRMVLNDGSSKVYLIKEGCSVTLDGAAAASTDVLKAGDLVTVTLENNAVTKITAITGQGLTNTNNNTNTNGTNSTTNGNTTSTTTAPANTMTSGEITAKKYTGNGYVLSLVEGNVEGQVTVPTGAKITRNGKTVNMSDIRIGDTVKLTSSAGVVSHVAATGEKKMLDGTIKSLSIGGTSTITITTKGEDVTYTLGSDTEYYDNNTNTYINIRDLHIGQEVAFSVESKEVVTLDVEKNNDSYKYMGTITNVSRGGDYIEVLVDYDYVTGESKVYKRIQTPSNLEIMQNGQRKNRSYLDEDMDVLIYFKYLDDSVPVSIHIL